MKRKKIILIIFAITLTIITIYNINETNENDIQINKSEKIVKETKEQKDNINHNKKSETIEEIKTETKEQKETEIENKGIEKEIIKETENNEEIQENNNVKVQEVQKVEESNQNTEGFNANGYHFPIAGFTGSGHVPADNYIYQWDELDNYYLAERAAKAGEMARGMYYNDIITINNQKYQVIDILEGQSIVPNYENNEESQAFQNIMYMRNIGKGDIIIQTCETNNVPSTMKLIFANKI